MGWNAHLTGVTRLCGLGWHAHVTGVKRLHYWGDTPMLPGWHAYYWGDTPMLPGWHAYYWGDTPRYCHDVLIHASVQKVPRGNTPTGHVTPNPSRHVTPNQPAGHKVLFKYLYCSITMFWHNKELDQMHYWLLTVSKFSKYWPQT